MKYMQSWQDFMRMPENKALKESKGIHACKQKFIQEQNKMQWHDPVMLQENGDAGISLTNSTNTSAGGGSNGFITGFTREVSTLTIPSPDANLKGATASLNTSVTVNALATGSDFSFGHTALRKKVGLFIVTGSTMGATHFTAAGLSTSGFDVVVTASIDAGEIMAGGVGGAGFGAWTGSLLNLLGRNIKNQSATATVVGFTNTIAPSTLITADTGSAPYNVLTITNKTRGAVTDASTTFVAATASLAISTPAVDTYLGEEGGLIFDGQVAPFTSIPFNTDSGIG